MSRSSVRSNLGLATLALLTVLLGGCGASEALAPAVAAPEARARAEARAFLLPGAHVVAYANWPRLQASNLDAWFNDAAIGPLGKMAEEVRSTCGIEVVDAVGEVVVSMSPRAGDDPLIATSLRIAAAEVEACLDKLLKAPRAESVGEHRVLVGDDGISAVVVDEVLVVGPDAPLRESLRSYDSVGGRISRVLPDPRRTIAFMVAPLDDRLAAATSVSFDADDAGELSFRFSVYAHSTQLADWVTREGRTLLQTDRAVLTRKLEPQRRERLEALLSSATVRRAVLQQVEITAPLLTSVSMADLRDIGKRFGAELRRRHAVAVAKSEVDELARIVGERAAASGKQPRLVDSIPPSGASDPHPRLRELGFQIASEQFEFRVDTTHWKRTAVVRAIGDTDGDGQTTELSMTVKLTSKGEVEFGPLEQRGDDE
jgi:hypothetical protein